MAEAPGHRLGQIIGDTLELAVGPALAGFAERHGLYLDGKGERSARSGKKVTWSDDLGNSHDLDYVIERGGTDHKVGLPVAFIESAWRRYTKHSRAKAQEIQGAVLPLLGKWGHVKPFAGVVLAGEWTSGSLEQLASNGFSILHVPTETVARVFRHFDIEVVAEERTPDDLLQAQVDRWEALTTGQREELGQALRDAISNDLRAFMDDLQRVVLRRIASVSVLPLHGSTTECMTVAEAISSIEAYRPNAAALPLVRFEVIVHYDNGDRITADFGSAADAVLFLSTFR